MSKQEKLSWIAFLVILAASACLAWLLFSAWPDTAQFSATADSKTRPLMWGVMGVIGAFWYYRQARPEVPYEDERERAIANAGYTQGLVALVLMQLTLGIVVAYSDGLLARLDPVWVRYFLLLEVGATFVIVFGYRLVRYRLH